MIFFSIIEDILLVFFINRSFFVFLQTEYDVQFHRIHYLSASNVCRILAAWTSWTMAEHICGSSVLLVLRMVGLAVFNTHCHHYSV